MASYANGRWPASALVTVYGSQTLERAAAAAYHLLAAAYAAAGFGSLIVTEGYRSYDRQVFFWNRYVNRSAGWTVAAKPGTSKHGVGGAIDFGGKAATRGTPQHTWLVANAPRFGYKWTGVNFNEAWHFDFMGTPATTTTSSQIVKDRQNWLNASQNAKLTVDGINGSATRNAIKNYQKVLGVTADGIWGNGTQAAHQKYFDAWHKPAVSGSGDPLIRAAQQKLKTNYPAYAGKLTVDGINGAATKAAVKEFQRRSGLQADGIIGAKTRAKLGI